MACQAAWFNPTDTTGHQAPKARLVRLSSNTRPHSGTASKLAGPLTGVTRWKYQATKGIEASQAATEPKNASATQRRAALPARRQRGTNSTGNSGSPAANHAAKRSPTGWIRIKHSTTRKES